VAPTTPSPAPERRARLPDVLLFAPCDQFTYRVRSPKTHLEALVAEGETSEERLAVSGLAFLKQSSLIIVRRGMRQEISSGSLQRGSGLQRSSLISLT